MKQIAFFTAVCFVVAPASAPEAAEFDLAKHRIQTVEIAMPPGLEELYGWMNEYHLFNNVMRFEWSKLDIAVARSASMRPSADRGLEQAGFDPESLEIQWLDSGRLIWLRWETFPQGQGRYSKQGHLILQVDITVRSDTPPCRRPALLSAPGRSCARQAAQPPRHVCRVDDYCSAAVLPANYVAKCIAACRH
jgi:hypothetical protein